MPTWSFSKSCTRITVNGQTYNSVEEMPSDVRQQYEKAMSALADENRNGIPDVLEGVGDKAVVTQVTRTEQAGVTGTRSKTSVTPIIRSRVVDSSTQFTDDRSSPGTGINIQWTTLVALILTVVVLTIAVMWAMKH